MPEWYLEAFVHTQRLPLMIPVMGSTRIVMVVSMKPSPGTLISESARAATIVLRVGGNVIDCVPTDCCRRFLL